MKRLLRVLLLVAFVAFSAAAEGPAAAEAVAVSAEGATAAEDDILLTYPVTLTPGGGGGVPTPVSLNLRQGEDAAAAVVLFCERHDVRAVDSVLNLANNLIELMAKRTPPIEPPAELRLRTAGAHKKKAEEMSKDGEHDQAAMQLIRALVRPGLDEQMIERLKETFSEEMIKLGRQREAEAAEAAEAAAAEARRAEEAAALIEARTRAERNEADWMAYLTGQAASSIAGGKAAAEGVAEGMAATAAADTGREPPILSMPVQLQAPPTEKGGEPGLVTKHVEVRAGQDAPHAVFAFCTEHGLHSADEVIATDCHPRFPLIAINCHRSPPIPTGHSAGAVQLMPRPACSYCHLLPFSLLADASPPPRR